MNFYCIPYKGHLPENAEFPCISLTSDSWNDYGYITYFYLKLHLNSKKSLEIGGVKILNKENNQTILDDKFTQLNESFCSLGQSMDYYNALKNKGVDLYTQVLVGLNDIVFNKKLKEGFPEGGLYKSLRRFSESEKSYREAGKYFGIGSTHTSDYSFTFKTMLPKAQSEHEINFDFSPSDIPYRIMVLIGKNGTGKTKILSYISLLLSGLSNSLNGKFEPQKPSFSKIIVIAYSAFDNDYIVPDIGERTFSYVYCGVRDNENTNVKALLNRIKISIKKVEEADRQEDWETVISEIIGENIAKVIYEKIARESEFDDYVINQLSSGQQVILAIITDVIVNIKTESLIIFDEPEIHLHPNALVKLIKAVNILLEKFDSYAIIATHSPLILQEVPSQRVRVLERVGVVPLIRGLGIESFGENLTVITNEIFGIDQEDSNYKNFLKVLSKKYSNEEILKMFDGKLGFNAKIFLENINKEE